MSIVKKIVGYILMSCLFLLIPFIGYMEGGLFGMGFYIIFCLLGFMFASAFVFLLKWLLNW